MGKPVETCRGDGAAADKPVETRRGDAAAATRRRASRRRYGGFANKSKERDIVERNGGDANAVADAFRGGPASRRGVARGLNIGGCLTFCVYSADGAAFISRRRVAAPSSRPAPKKWLVVGLHRPGVEALATSLGALDGASVVLNATDSIYAAAHQAR